MCQENKHISTSEYRVNRAIRVKEVRLIDADGENRGIVPIEEALQIAAEAGLDLIEVAPNSKPPVCRVVSYGKFTYERTKKEREARKAQKKVEIKEIRLRPKTTEHHRGFKTKAARGWLKEGKKVKVRIRFRGRERDYPEIALQDLKEIAAELQDISIIEQAPEFEGRTLLMVLAPNENAAKEAAKSEAKDTKEEPATEVSAEE
ncbi:MAG TPA: translation initiation factor IF-3 [Anaerolineales bacterium]|nr:translation initiation factor IF-3 [Anaerolineales bacterium]HRQ93282.1 translation initiation factor IF-3 [Anaerolineales bacterium]